MRAAGVVLLGVTVLAAAVEGGAFLDGPPDDMVGCDVVSCPSHVPQTIGGYGPTTVSTDNARVAYEPFPLGAFQAGTSLRIGTCGMSDASFGGNTFLRLFVAGTEMEVASNNDSCAGRGSQINYVVPYDMSLELHAGCAGDSIGCGGRISAWRWLDANPRPTAVKAAFRRVRKEGVLAKSPDAFTLIRGIYYENEGAGAGEKYHHQGIARTYNRSQYDIVWTTSVHDGGAPEYNSIFFTRMGSKRTTRVVRFGGNLIGGEGTLSDAVLYGSNAGVYDGFDPYEDGDWDGVPAGRRLDHAGGIQAIGNFVATASEFVSRPCYPWAPDCPEHGDWNIPATGQASQVVLYNIAQASPQPSLLISRRGRSSGWVALAKLRQAQAPPVLQNGYLAMVPNGNRLDLYAIPADPCTGFVSLSQVKPYRATTWEIPPALDPLAPRTCPGVRTRAEQAEADWSQVSSVGCVKRTEQGNDPPSDTRCPNLVAMYEDGEAIDFPDQADVQSANFVTQANGKLYLLAFWGQQTEWGPNSEVQLWRVVFGAGSGADPALRTMPDGTECQPFLCLVRAGTEEAKDSYKNMDTTGINGAMFRFGGGGYIVVPTSDPALETFFLYGTGHYLQHVPRAAVYNEF